jgi:hypothetical protein
MHNGSCLCGAVTFEVAGDLPGPDACHCSTCRKHSGHYFASTDVPKSEVSIHGEDKVTWYHSSEKAPTGLLLNLRLIAVLGPTLSRLDRHRHGRV